MGSYSAPAGFQWHYEKIIVDNTNLADTIVLDIPRCGDFAGIVTMSTLYDGRLDVYLEMPDGSFDANLQDWHDADSSRFISKDYWVAVQKKIPYHIRWKCSTQCTVGVATIYLNWLDAPTNPLY